jgi:hypothetical protein
MIATLRTLMRTMPVWTGHFLHLFIEFTVEQIEVFEITDEIILLALGCLTRKSRFAWNPETIAGIGSAPVSNQSLPPDISGSRFMAVNNKNR